MNNVIGPISHAHWYCMRQCRESINHLTPLAAKTPIYEIEIKGEKELYREFMNQVIQRKAA